MKWFLRVIFFSCSINNICAIDLDTENWMSLLNDNELITNISIPASHNSCTYTTSIPFSKCQTQNLQQQLNYGVRYLDLRFLYKKEKLQMYHGWDNLGISFESCLGQIKDFLDKHPSEIILLRLQREKLGGPITDDTYYDAIVSTFDKVGLPLIDSSELTDLKIGNLRGKTIVVEYNNILNHNPKTYPHITGYSYWGYFSNKEQVEAKWQDILAKEVFEADTTRFNRFNLYASGGQKILGITVPNPKSFTKLFAKIKLADISDLIEKNRAIYIVDFEELFFNKAGEFYRMVIESNELQLPENINDPKATE